MARRKEEEKVLDVNATMEGSLVFSDPINLRINGKFTGTLTAKGTLIIGQSAQVSAEILGETVSVAGKVKGKIKAIRQISFDSTAEVFADIEAPRLAIEEGAVFNGNCLMPQEKMTLDELSDYLSVEEKKVREWVDSGKIPSTQVGQDLLFDRKEVDTWIAQNV